MVDSVQIQFDGKRFGFWQSVSIRESIDELCASVSLGIAVPLGEAAKLRVSANSLVKVLIDGELVTTIRAGKFDRRASAQDYQIRLDARSLGRDLVDCQYSKTLSNLKLGEVVKNICSTFEVPVKIDAQTVVVPDFSMQCETPANALINAARVANLLLYPQADGGLILTAPDNSASVATLVFGKNFTDYDISDNYDTRFSEYVVKGSDLDGKSFKGAANDSGIGFFRPMHIVADRGGNSNGACDRRAKHELNRRLARAHAINITMPTFRHASGLWAINKQVRVVIPHEEIDGVFLIGSREFTLDEKSGAMTRLQLMHRNAFVGEPPVKRKRSAGARK